MRRSEVSGPLAERTVEELEALIGAAIESALGPLGDKLNEWIIEHAPEDQGIFKRGVKKAFAGVGITRRLLLINDAADEEWVLEGVAARAPKSGRIPKGLKWPLVSALQGWITRQLGITDPDQLRRAYFAVATKIMREGIPGHPLYDQVQEVNRALIDAGVMRAEDSIVRILNG